MKKLSMLLTIFLTACGFDKDECVYFRAPNAGFAETTKAAYLSYSSASYWLNVDGKVHGIHNQLIIIESCNILPEKHQKQ